MYNWNVIGCNVQVSKQLLLHSTMLQYSCNIVEILAALVTCNYVEIVFSCNQALFSQIEERENKRERMGSQENKSLMRELVLR